MAPPRARIDDFRLALTAKIHEVFDLAAAHDCNAIVIPGDIGDSPNMSYSTFAELGKLLSQAPRPIWAVPGNHDIFGANPETKYRTPFGALAQLGIIGDLTEELFESGKDDLFQLVAMTGNPFSANTDVDITSYLFCGGCIDSNVVPHRVKIQVAHGMLLERAPSFELRHTLISDVAAHPNAPDVLIVGHEHVGFGVLRVPRPGKAPMIVINPGALCRLTAHPAEIERTVQVCLLTVHDDGQIDAELLPLKSARPGHEVLSREHLEMQAAKEERVAAFLALLAEEGEARVLSVMEIIASIAERDKLPPEVKEEALRRLSRAREEIGALVA